MKNLIIWLVGTLILSPIPILFLSATFWGIFLSVVYAAVIFFSTGPFEKFWNKWWQINCYCSTILDGGK